MKLRQLEFVREIARTGSFSHAADICNATQPTLSNAVGQLEDELGAKIFHRTTRSVELTPFGGYILPYLEAVLNARSEMEKACEAYLRPDHRVLRVGLSPLVDMGLLNEVLQPYRNENPEVAIYFKECLLDDLAGRLASGSVDIAVVPHHMIEAGWDHLGFYSDPLFYIPSDGADVPEGGSLEISLLPDSPIIMTGGGCGLNRS
ncbi:MAG: LysR family transcriptional regulator, partial [Maritimibacter sp.]